LKDPHFGALKKIVERAKESAMRLIEHVDETNVDLYVIVDEPERTSYRTYSWNPESTLDSIWLVGPRIQPHPIEMDEGSRIIEGLKRTRFFPRLIVPREVRDAFRQGTQ
jgi:hypothetical protein